MPFDDRRAAGRALAEHLMDLCGRPIVVLGLPRGGVPVADEVAAALGAPLDVIIVRKLGVPWQPELAFGAIGEDGVRVLDERVIRSAGVSPDDIEAVEERERAELERRAAQYRAVHPRQPLRDRTAIVVDDGIATGSTARAACAVARAQLAGSVVVAVPVAPPGWDEMFAGVADETRCVEMPPSFRSVGQAYADFSPTADEEVLACLRRAASRPDRPS